MNILDAAYEVLKSAKKAMTPKEIVALVLDSGMWTTTGKTPWDTLAAALYCDIKNNGKGSRFSKVGKGQLFALNETAVGVSAAQDEFSFVPPERKLWGVHCVIEEEAMFRKNNVIAIGWHEMGDLSSLPPTREAYKCAYAKIWPESSKQSVANQAGQLYRFVCEAKVGDYVVFPSKADRKINIGQIVGDYFFCNTTDRFVQQRKVKWLKTLPRTSFSQGALYEAGSAMTFFMLKNYADEFLTALRKEFKPKTEEVEAEEDIAATAENISQQTEDFILKELSKKTKGYPLENFVAALFNAMGYRTQISKKGGDRGTDIVAYKDELPPRIIVQVKSQDGDIPEKYVSQLGGTLKQGDYGVFVCLSDFSANARTYILENPRIKGINGRDLAALVLKYYDQLVESARDIIPLKKVYIPVAK